MNGQYTSSIAPDVPTVINTQTVYSAGNIHFAVDRFFKRGKIQIGYSQSQEARLNDAIQTQVTVDGQSKDLVAYGKKGL
jgi:hypothetical protein